MAAPYGAFGGAEEGVLLDSIEQLFLAARRSVSRTACDQWLKTRNINMDDAASVSIEKQKWRALPLLLDPALITFASRALHEARGRYISSTEPFPLMVWRGGATDTKNGRKCAGTFGNFVALLRERAQHLAPKRAGWVVEPTTNTDGHRANASTKAMHALFLDCDGAAEWKHTHDILTSLDYAFVAYQSGGWSPASPKWRIVLPLSQPFETHNAEQIAMWKVLYNHCRVVLGAVGGLLGEGFDPTTETPCCPWFLTERRAATDTERVVIWRTGFSLDLMALAIALPAIEEDDAPTKKSTPRNAKVEVFDDIQVENIVTALTIIMQRYTSSRRDLYLALTGVLCDRGAADNAVDIVEEISFRVPGEQDRHGEHVHCAKTTVECWRQGKPHTQIGTLQERWPDVAAVLDEVLPNAAEKAIADSMRQLLDAATPPPPPLPPQVPTTVSVTRLESPTDRKVLRKFVVQLRRKKIHRAKKADKEKNDEQTHKNAVDGLLLDQLLKEKSLTLPDIDRNSAITRVARLLAFKLPRFTPRSDVTQLFRGSVNAMLTDGESPDAMLNFAEISYLVALDARIKLVDARNAAMIANDEQGR